MRKLFFVALVGAPLGCQHNPNSFAWRFECGRPGSSASYAIVQPAATAYGVSGLCAGPAAGPLGPTFPVPMPQPVLQYATPPAGPCGAPPPPSMADLLTELRALRRSMQQAPPAPPPQMLPMPRGCNLTQLVQALAADEDGQE